MESEEGFLESLEVVPHCFENVPLKAWVHRLPALVTIWPFGRREPPFYTERSREFFIGIAFSHKQSMVQQHTRKPIKKHVTDHNGNQSIN